MAAPLVTANNLSGGRDKRDGTGSSSPTPKHKPVDKSAINPSAGKAQATKNKVGGSAVQTGQKQPDASHRTAPQQSQGTSHEPQTDDALSKAKEALRRGEDVVERPMPSRRRSVSKDMTSDFDDIAPNHDTDVTDEESPAEQFSEPLDVPSPSPVNGTPIYDASSPLGNQALGAAEPVAAPPSDAGANPMADAAKKGIDLSKKIKNGDLDKLSKAAGKLPGKAGDLGKLADGALKKAKGGLDKAPNPLKKALKEPKQSADIAKKLAKRFAKKPASAIKAKLIVLAVPIIKVVAIVLLVLIVVNMVSSCMSMVLGGSSESSSDDVLIEEQRDYIPTAKVNPVKTVCGESGSSSNAADNEESGSKVTVKEDCVEVESKALGDWTYYNQCSPNWDLTNPATGKSDGINWKSGCGVVCMAMIMTSYSHDAKYTPTYLALNGLSDGNAITPGKVANYMNARTTEFGLHVSYAEGTKHWKEDANWEKVKATCAGGGCVIIGQNKISTTDGHYIVLRKIENGTVTYADPATGAEGTVEESALRSYGYNANGITQAVYYEKV